MQGARKIAFREFEKALGLLAAEKGVSVDAVQAAVVASGGPQRNSTTPAANVRLHDDKSTYTGVTRLADRQANPTRSIFCLQRAAPKDVMLGTGPAGSGLPFVCWMTGSTGIAFRRSKFEMKWLRPG